MAKATLCATLLAIAIAIPVFSFVTTAPADEEKVQSSKQPVAENTILSGKKPSTPADDESPLGKTVRLTFTITNDDGAHPFPVTCAARSFHIERDVSEADGSHQMKFIGYIKAVDQADKIFVRFECEQYHSNDKEGVDATFRLKGSALLKLGKKIDIGHLAEDKVSLEVAVVE